ncbi:MAG: hypothetical protein Q8M16_21510 [Pirellulaceae bacterium]|nr:hypothetical protein [Pirellulaceae bacterium]
MTELHFLAALPASGGFLLAFSLAALAWWLYWREVHDFPRPAAWLLPSLRALAIALVVLMLLEPTLRYRSFEGTPTRLHVWVDATTSMQETDQATLPNTPARSRFGRAIDYLTAGDSPRLEQWADQGEVVWQKFGGERMTPVWQSTLEQPQSLPLDRSAWEETAWEQPTSLSFVLASERTRVLGAVGSTTNDAAVTDDKDPSPSAKTEARSQNGSERNFPILLFTDGRHNSGPSPLEVLAQWPQESAPVFVVGLGARTPPEKVTLLKLDVPKNVNRTDRVQGTVQLQDGLKPDQRYAVEIYHADELLWAEELSATGLGIRSQSFSFSIADVVKKLEAAIPSGQTAARINLPISAMVKFVPTPGDSNRGSTEKTSDDQSLTSVMGVTTRKQRVLLLDSRSRWETRYVRNMLERDSGWELDSYLVGADVPPKWFSNLPAERPFPVEFEDFERYDLFVCGELEINSLTPEQLEHIRRAVERGAGWIVSDGRFGYWRDPQFASWQKALPIDWLPDEAASHDRSWQAEPTEDGDRLGMLSLEVEVGRSNSDVWRELRPLRLLVPTKPLPGSRVLATATHQGEAWPLFVTRTYGAGRVFYAASDETWRWRYEVADVIHQRLWNQVCRWTMREPFAAENEYLGLDSGDVRYDQGQEINVRARVKDSQGQPSTLASIEAVALVEGTAVATINLEQVPDVPGIYRGRMAGLPAGDYEVQLAIPGYSAEMLQLKTSFRIEKTPDPEGLDVTRNDALLMEIANATGGLYVPEERIEEMWQALKLRYTSRVVESDQQIWQSFWWFVPILVIVGLEWWLRKKVGLI